MKPKVIVLYLIGSLLILLQPEFLSARNAPITTAGSSTVCPGGAVIVPVTVTGFTTIKAFTLRLDFDPTQLTFDSATNIHPFVSGTSFNAVNINPNLTKIIIFWFDVTALTLTDGTALLNLNFTLTTGSPFISFNNTDNSGGDCEYADENNMAMNDTPTSTYYINSTITNLGVAPAGNITGFPSFCAGTNNVAYSVTPIANASSYIWTVPPGTTIVSGGNTSSVLVNYSTAAVSGNITVAGTNVCGPGVPSSLPVTIYPLPAPVITGLGSLCAGSTGIPYTTDPGMDNYAWTVSSGGMITSGAATNSILVNWNSAGQQSVTVNYAIPATGCIALTPTSKTVTVNPLPIPTISGPASVCAGSTGNLYATEAGMTGYLWTVSPGGTITAGGGTSNNTVTVSWNAAVTQSVGVNYVNAAGCTAIGPVAETVTVNPLPGAAGVITGITNVCAGNNGVSYSISPIPNANSYTWTLPAGATIASGAGTNNITVNFSASSVSGNITVMGNNSCGNGSPSPPFTVIITQMPAAAGIITGPEIVCSGTNGVIYSVPAIPNATTYEWTVPAGASITAGATTNQIVVSFGATPGTGVITVKGINMCGSGTVSSDFAVAMILSTAAPVVTAAGPLLTSTALTGNQWYYEGTGAIAGATGQTYLATVTGWYWTIVLGVGCPSLESNHVYVLFTGQDEQKKTAFNVYPNPNDGKFSILITSSMSEAYTVLIYNQIGKMIFKLDDILMAGTFEKQIDIRTAPDGIYSMVFTSGLNKTVQKILINR